MIARARLAEIADLNPRFSERLDDDELVSFLPMAAVTEDGTTSPGADRQYSTLKSGYTPFLNGDVLVAKITPCFENGKIAQARVRRRVGFGSTEFHVVRPQVHAADGRYIHHFLRLESVRRRGQQRMTGSAGQRRVPESFLADLEVPLPTVLEQRRIAEVLDRAEALRTKRRAATARLDELARAIFLDMFGDLGVNAGRWPRATLGDVVTFVGGGTPSRARPEYFDGAICWATSKDMRAPYLDDTEEHVTEEAICGSATKLVPAGTILVVVKSKVLMHRLPVAVARVPTCFGQDLKGIEVGENCRVPFVATALRVGSDWLLSRARGVNTEGLTLDHLRAFPLVLPPVEVQDEFGARLLATERVGESYAQSMERMDSLFSSLQHRAFSGQL